MDTDSYLFLVAVILVFGCMGYVTAMIQARGKDK